MTTTPTTTVAMSESQRDAEISVSACDDLEVREEAALALEHALLLGHPADVVKARIRRIPVDLLDEQAAQMAADDREARFHEGGHAVVALVSGIGLESVHVGRDRARHSRGHVLVDGRVPVSHAAIQARVIFTMAGDAAASLFGVCSGASSGDVAEANRLAQLLGFDDHERRTFLDHCSARAQRACRDHARWVEAVAEALRERRDLAGADVLALRPAPLPDEDPV